MKIKKENRWGLGLLKSVQFFKKIQMLASLAVLISTSGWSQGPAYPNVQPVPTTFTVLHHFAGNPNDGNGPVCGLTKQNGALYGTTFTGGIGDIYHDDGTLFKINLDGSGYQTLHTFYDGNSSDGAFPVARPYLLGNTIYGTTSQAGIIDPSAGTVYSCNLSGGPDSILHSFVFANGINPESELESVGNTLFGTTLASGDTESAAGVIFRLSGGTYTILHNFDMYNGDGYNPFCGLTKGAVVGTNTVFYGTTQQGGSEGLGTIYKINSNESGYQSIYSFGTGTNGDAQGPRSRPLYVNGVLYGTTYGDGPSYATIYRINADGTDFAILYRIYGGGYLGTPVLNNDTLYGAASSGIIYSVKTDGSDYRELYNFNTNSANGTTPHCELTLVAENSYIVRPCCPGSTNFTCDCVYLEKITNSILYGTTVQGGLSNCGTIFALPLYAATSSVPAIIVTSPTNKTFFNYPANIGFTVIVTNISPVKQVDYYAGMEHLGTVTNYPYSFTWTNATPGTNIITVLASDTSDNVAGTNVIVIVDFPGAPTVAFDSISSSTYSFTAHGYTNTPWTLYSSTNLTDWMSMGLVVLDNSGDAVIDDTGIAGVAYNFYTLANPTHVSRGIGFERISVPAHTTNAIANQLEVATNTLNALFKPLPDGSTLPGGAFIQLWTYRHATNFSWNGSSWLPNGEAVLSTGAGAVLFNGTSTNTTVVFVGLVPEGTLTVSLASGDNNLVSSKVPQAGEIKSVLGYNPNLFDMILQWTGPGFITSIYDPLSLDEAGSPTDWYDWSGSSPIPEPTVNVGESVFIIPNGSNTWMRIFQISK